MKNIDEEIIKRNYDVIIVGAGPAGTSAACFLADQGFEILLLDKEKFPRDKVCGDGITASSIQILDRMGVLASIEQIKPFKTYGIIISSPAGDIINGNYPSMPGLRNYGYVIPRKRFDALLLDHVRHYENITIIEEFRVIDIIFSDNRFTGISGRYGEDTISLKGKFMIGADGCHSIVARKLDLIVRNPRHKAFCLRAYFDNVDNLKDRIEIHYEKSVMPGYGWIFPTGEGTANIGFGSILHYRSFKNFKRLYGAFFSNNKYTREKLGNAKMREGTLKGCYLSLGTFSKKKGALNALLLGDAASFIDPLSGEGIYYALKSGEYAAMAISMSMHNQGLMEDTVSIYEDLCKKEFKWKEFVTGSILQYFLSKESFINFSLKRASRSQKKADTMAAVIGHYWPKKKLFFNL